MNKINNVLVAILAAVFISQISEPPVPSGESFGSPVETSPQLAKMANASSMPNDPFDCDARKLRLVKSILHTDRTYQSCDFGYKVDRIVDAGRIIGVVDGADIAVLSRAHRDREYAARDSREARQAQQEFDVLPKKRR